MPEVDADTAETIVSLIAAATTTPMAIHVFRLLSDTGLKRYSDVEDWLHYVVRVWQIPFWVTAPAATAWVGAIGGAFGTFRGTADEISIPTVIAAVAIATICWITAIGQHAAIVEHRRYGRR